MKAKPDMHNVDVGIRAVVMQAARAKLADVREQETRATGVPVTTMASVGRAILVTWTPELMSQAEPGNVLEEVDEVERDATGARITTRGHRKYDPDDGDAVPEASRNATSTERATQLLRHLRKVADPKRGTTLGPIALVEKAATAEGLLDEVVSGKTLEKHIKAAERAVLKPLRFRVTEAAYQDAYRKLRAFNCTVTRALEVGLEKFARTGATEPKE